MSSVEQTLKERGNRYGDFTHHAAIAQSLQDSMRASDKGWVRLSPAQKQALTVIADKIARILSGDPNYADNWHDIQGYAKLVEDRLPSTQQGWQHASAGAVVVTPLNAQEQAQVAAKFATSNTQHDILQQRAGFPTGDGHFQSQPGFPMGALR